RESNRGTAADPLTRLPCSKPLLEAAAEHPCSRAAATRGRGIHQAGDRAVVVVQHRAAAIAVGAGAHRGLVLERVAAAGLVAAGVAKAERVADLVGQHLGAVLAACARVPTAGAVLGDDVALAGLPEAGAVHGAATAAVPGAADGQGTAARAAEAACDLAGRVVPDDGVGRVAVVAEVGAVGHGAGVGEQDAAAG